MAGGPVATGGGVDSKSPMIGVLMSAFAAFGGILFGFDTGQLGGILAMESWLEVFGTYGELPGGTGDVGYYIKTSDKSLAVSILSAGTFFGALSASYLGNWLGRRNGIMAATSVFCLGVGLQLDTKWACFIVGRVFAGFGVGIVSCLVPMYQSECAPKALRGMVVGLYQFAVTIGLLLAACVDEGTKLRPDNSAWRIPIAIQFAWAAVLCGGLFFLPESPRFYLLKGRDAEARTAMARLTGRTADDVEVDQACLEITAALQAERALGEATWLDCFKNGPEHNGLRTWTGILLQGFQQLTGINFIFYYGTTFFKQAGFENPFVITIITDVVNVVMTLPGIFVIDRFGRRSLLIWGAVVMLVCEYIVAIVGVTVGGETASGAVNDSAQKCLIAFVCIYIAAFASTWGPIAWVIIGEIFPLQLRGKQMALSTASNWFWNCIIGVITPYLVDPSTTGVNGIKTADLGVKVFFLWGSTCVLCLLFAFFIVPETKGLSLEQIDLMYRNSSSWTTLAIKSNSVRAAILAEHATFANQHGEVMEHEGKVDKAEV